MDFSRIFRDRISALIAKSDSLIFSPLPKKMGHETTQVDQGRFAGWRLQAIRCLTELFGPKDLSVITFTTEVQKNYLYKVEIGKGILVGVLEDLDNGHLISTRALVSADLLSDLLAQVQHLLAEGYKDAAAALCGGVFEQGLREIAASNRIELKDSDNIATLIQKLMQKKVLDRHLQSDLSRWTHVRNLAAHGRFCDFDLGTVKKMHKGVSEFLETRLDARFRNGAAGHEQP